MKLAKRNNKLPIIIALTVTLVAVGVFLYWRQLNSAEPTRPEAKVETNQSEVEPDKTMIELPNTKPIVAMEGDYDEDSHLWRLVNKSHPLNDINYRPEIAKPNVPTRTDKSLDEQSVRKDIAPAVEELFAAAKTAGYDLQIGSGFRSAAQQKIYYDNYSRLYGQAAADTFSAKPGYSEHQTGLVVDVSETNNNCYLEECFGDTEAGKWLADNAHKHGFILRYPENKDGITDFRYEPWHFRYVGKDLATALYESGLTLDEAAPYLEKAVK